MDTSLKDRYLIVSSVKHNIYLWFRKSRTGFVCAFISQGQLTFVL